MELNVFNVLSKNVVIVMSQILQVVIPVLFLISYIKTSASNFVQKELIQMVQIALIVQMDVYHVAVINVMDVITD
jgi:hypothetical protein